MRLLVIVLLFVLTPWAHAQTDTKRFHEANFEVGHEGTLPEASESHAAQFGRSPASLYKVVKIKGEKEAIVQFNLLNVKNGPYYYFVGWPMEGKIDNKYYQLTGGFRVAGTHDAPLARGGSQRMFKIERVEK